ncbi:MAG: DNA replication/repair protein RecF [Methylococcales bacterium]|nr:DNA replication/repair protein RecF [Methylococcales bacterium]
MTLLGLTIDNLRLLTRVSLSPGSHINFITGDNGSGKSSLLEAIYLLGHGRSPKTDQLKQLIHYGADQFRVTGQIRHGHGQLLIGVGYVNQAPVIHIQQSPTKRRDQLATLLPLQFVAPDSERLLTGAPQQRRAFLSWGAFHHTPMFFQSWRAYQAALKQRNALLKRPPRQQTDLLTWNHELAHHGQTLHELVYTYLAELKPALMTLLNRFLPGLAVEFSYRNGWASDLSLEEALWRDQDRDLRHGFTHSGPHRSDLVIKLKQGLARDYLSRGQVRLLVLAMKLAQLNGYYQHPARLTRPCLLIDDFMLELDQGNQQRLLDYLCGLDAQIFLTATAFSPELLRQYDAQVIHLQQGQITENVCQTRNADAHITQQACP